MRRLRWKFSPVKRGLVLRKSARRRTVRCERIVPVRKPWPSGEKGTKPMPSSRSSGRTRVLEVAGPQGVLRLQRGDRVDGVGAADRVGPGRGQADVADLALGDELGDRADGVLDRRVRVDAVLVVQVDVVGAQPSQRALDGGADVGRAAVEVPRALAGVGDQAELGGQHDLVAAALQRPADEFLVDVGAVDLGGVDERHARGRVPGGWCGWTRRRRCRRRCSRADMPIAPRPMRDTFRSLSWMYFT